MLCQRRQSDWEPQAAAFDPLRQNDDIDRPMNLFPPRPTNAPSKAFRGKGRYFRGVRDDADSFRFDPGSLDCWDHWHYHADWLGLGNLRWGYRREHLNALCVVFEKIARVKDQFPSDFQTWIYLSSDDAGQDATYVHSPNPNGGIGKSGASFPFCPDGLTWDVPELGEYLSRQLPRLEMRVGSGTMFDKWREPPGETTSYFAYAVGVGLPLEPGRKEN